MFEMSYGEALITYRLTGAPIVRLEFILLKDKLIVNVLKIRQVEVRLSH